MLYENGASIVLGPRSIGMQTSEFERTVSFLNRIGLPVTVQVGASGFVKGVRISRGSLVVDPACEVSAILHEAGHCACIPQKYRSWIDDDVGRGIRHIFEHVNTFDLHPDHPFIRALIQCSDPEATAWAWAAGSAIGLAPEQIIRDHEYGGEGENIRMQLLPSLRPTSRITGYIGIHGLVHAGFCALWEGADLPRYPRLRMWLQDAAIKNDLTPIAFGPK